MGGAQEREAPAERETNQQGRETKRQKVQYKKEESGVGSIVEQLEFNRDKPENATKLEKFRHDYYYGPHCSKETHPEGLEHHAAEIAYTWYSWLTNELICPMGPCLPRPPVMTCISVTDAHHAALMNDMRHTSEQTFCHTIEGMPCCNKYTRQSLYPSILKVDGKRETIKNNPG